MTSDEKVLDHDIPEDVAKEVYDKAEITTENVPQMDEGQNADCHGKRNVVRSVKSKIGIVMQVGGLYIISDELGTRRYYPCNLKEDLQKEGMKVIFDGEILEIFPNERLIGTPFRLTFIRETD